MDDIIILCFNLKNYKTYNRSERKQVFTSNSKFQIKRFEQLEIAKKIVESRLKQKVVKVRIDNIFFSKKNYENVDMVKVYKFMQNSPLFHADYNIELFAGMYLHPKKCEYPTILFFRTGSYTMMGAMKKDILIECQTLVNNLILMFNKHCI